MKTNGVEYQFNRMLKVVLYTPRGGSYTVEYNPRKADYLCCRMEANVIDIPSADQDNKPGFTAQVKIYNPGRELLTLITNNITWLFTPEQWAALKDKSDSIKEKEIEANLQDYYKSRLQMSISAGYWSEELKDTKYVTIFHGFVNETSFVHKGTDDVLTISGHDINVERLDVRATVTSLNAMRAGTEEQKFLLEQEERNRGAKNWDLTFKKFIRQFEDTMVVDGYLASVAPEARATTGWFRVLYVNSRSAYLKTKTGQYTEEEIINHPLKQKLTDLTGWLEPGSMLGFYSNGGNLAQMLKELCRYKNLNLGYDRFLLNETILTYIVYPVGAGTGYVPAEEADIKIYNYQNMLESASVDGAGKLNIKMMFNPECKCWLRIALVLTETLGKTHGVAGIKSFETSVRDTYGNIVGSLNSTTSLGTTVAINQLSGNMAVSAQQKELQTANKSGYMFNTGFPIVRVNHRLSTHGSAWQTEVATVPMIRGINVEEQ